MGGELNRQGRASSLLALLAVVALSMIPACGSEGRWWEECVDRNVSAGVLVEEPESDLLGLSLEEADQQAAGPFRRIAEDGECLDVTADLFPGRIDAVVSNGRVVAVYGEQQPS